MNNISRWYGFPNRSSIQNALSEFDKVVNEVFSDDFKLLPKFFSPKVNIYKKEGKYILDFYIPFSTKEDVDIQIEEDILTVHVKQRQDSSVKDDDYLVREVSRSQSTRMIALGEDIDQDSITAALKDGILNISFNSKEQAKPAPKKVEVK